MKKNIGIGRERAMMVRELREEEEDKKEEHFEEKEGEKLNGQEEK